MASRVTKGVIRWAPGTLMAVGAFFVIGQPMQRQVPLRASLDDSIPLEIAGYRGHDLLLSEGERQATGATNYLLRSYEAPDSTLGPASFSLYIGYYDSQSQGRTIHSPKNCLPGAGWEQLASQPAELVSEAGSATVNRYLLQRGDVQALVLYWYQGRGRIQANEYLVKRDLLRDAALRGRTDEALVRIVVPVETSEEDALDLASDVAASIIPPLGHALAP